MEGRDVGVDPPRLRWPRQPHHGLGLLHKEARNLPAHPHVLLLDGLVARDQVRAGPGLYHFSLVLHPNGFGLADRYRGQKEETVE